MRDRPPQGCGMLLIGLTGRRLACPPQLSFQAARGGGEM